MGRRGRKSKPRSAPVVPVDGLMDPEERRLRFVYQNGQRADTFTAVGSVVKAEFEKRCSEGPAWRRQLAAVIEEHAGQELLSKIEGMVLRKGVLQLEVTEPALRSALGFQWQQRLLAILQNHVPAAGITSVRFVMGR